MDHSGSKPFLFFSSQVHLRGSQSFSEEQSYWQDTEGLHLNLEWPVLKANNSQALHKRLVVYAWHLF